MQGKSIVLDQLEYQICVSRHSGRFSAFWFCPDPDCFGSHHNNISSETSEEAIGAAQEAARLHHQSIHATPAMPRFLREEDCRPRGLTIHG
jgi:hypothetical protein